MTQILGQLDVRKIRGVKRRFLALTDVEYVLNNGTRRLCRKHLEYDGGSVPQIAWSFAGCPFGGPGDDGYRLHDDWYEESRRVLLPPEQRIEADNGMLELHLYCGMEPVVAYGIYTAVRAASWRFWGAGISDLPSGIDDSEEWFWDQ